MVRLLWLLLGILPFGYGAEWNAVLRGVPGVDFPVFNNIPPTSFSCPDEGHGERRYYADSETGCQVFHLCYEDGFESFLCSPGTLFSERKNSCDFWYKVKCDSEDLASHNLPQQHRSGFQYKSNKLPRRPTKRPCRSETTSTTTTTQQPRNEDLPCPEEPKTSTTIKTVKPTTKTTTTTTAATTTTTTTTTKATRRPPSSPCPHNHTHTTRQPTTTTERPTQATTSKKPCTHRPRTTRSPPSPTTQTRPTTPRATTKSTSQTNDPTLSPTSAVTPCRNQSHQPTREPATTDTPQEVQTTVEPKIRMPTVAPPRSSTQSSTRPPTTTTRTTVPSTTTTRTTVPSTTTTRTTVPPTRTTTTVSRQTTSVIPCKDKTQKPASTTSAPVANVTRSQEITSTTARPRLTTEVPRKSSSPQPDTTDQCPCKRGKTTRRPVTSTEIQTPSSQRPTQSTPTSSREPQTTTTPCPKHQTSTSAGVQRSSTLTPTESSRHTTDGQDTRDPEGSTKSPGIRPPAAKATESDVNSRRRQIVSNIHVNVNAQPRVKTNTYVLVLRDGNAFDLIPVDTPEQERKQDSNSGEYSDHDNETGRIDVNSNTAEERVYARVYSKRDLEEKQKHDTDVHDGSSNEMFQDQDRAQTENLQSQKPSSLVESVIARVFNHLGNLATGNGTVGKGSSTQQRNPVAEYIMPVVSDVAKDKGMLSTISKGISSAVRTVTPVLTGFLKQEDHLRIKRELEQPSSNARQSHHDRNFLWNGVLSPHKTSVSSLLQDLAKRAKERVLRTNEVPHK